MEGLDCQCAAAGVAAAPETWSPQSVGRCVPALVRSAAWSSVYNVIQFKELLVGLNHH